MTELPPPRRPVSLPGVPLRAFIELQLYFDDMVRELQLIAVGHGEGDVALRLHDLTIHTQHEVARARNDLLVQAQAALDEGKDIADLQVGLRPSAVAATRALLPLAESLDQASRNGVLLTAPCSDTTRRMLKWIADQVEAQLVSGLEPTPYPS